MMFFIDFMGVGLVLPMFSAMFFRGDINLLAPETSPLVRGLLFGFVAALMPMAQFFSGPILGILSDRMGRKMLMQASTAFGVLGYLIAVLAVWHENIVLLAVSRIIVGIAAGNEAVGAAAIADISQPEEKANTFGLLHVAAGLGFMIGPFLGGKLSTMSLGIFSGYAAPFVCAGLLDVINLLMITFFFKETRTVKSHSGVISFGFSKIKKVCIDPVFFRLFLAIFFYQLGWSFYWEFIPVHWMQTYKFDMGLVGNLYALGALIYVLSAGILIRPIVARFKTEKILFYALLLCAFFVGLPLVFQAPSLYWFYIPVQQYFIALILPATTVLISNKSSKDDQGEMLGILASVQSLSLVIGPLLAGVVLGFTAKMPLIVGAGALFFAAYILRRSRRIV